MAFEKKPSPQEHLHKAHRHLTNVLRMHNIQASTSIATAIDRLIQAHLACFAEQHILRIVKHSGKTIATESVVSDITPKVNYDKITKADSNE